MAVVAPTVAQPSAQPPARRSPRVRWIAYLLLAPGLGWLFLFWLWPSIQMFITSLQTGTYAEGYTFTGNVGIYRDVLAAYPEQLFRSLVYALIVTVACLAIGYPLAYAIAMRAGRWKNAILFMVILPFFVSYIIRTLSWKFILADDGIFLGTLKSIGLLPDDAQIVNTTSAVLGGLIYNFLPFMVLPLFVSLDKIDPSLLEAAGDLYSNKRSTFLRVTLPLSLPGLLAGSLLTFIPVAGDFINAELLGNPNTTMLGNVIQVQMLEHNDYPTGAAISFILMAAILIGVFVYAKLLGTEELTG
ncbi:MAG: ABC transporter permease [Actinomycetota bacterium]